MNSSEIIKECVNGTIRKFTMENGQTFEAYVPNNCDENTQVITYEHGDNGYSSNWIPYQNYLQENECDTIIIHGQRNCSIDPYNHLVNQYNLNATSATTISFSGGTANALKKTYNMIAQNENCKGALSLILDGYAASPAEQNESFINSDTVILAIHQSNRSNNYLTTYENLAKTGVNMLILEDNSQYGTSHSGVNKSFLETSLINFITTGEKLPNNYKIKRYDPESKQFVEVSYEEVSTLSDVYSYFGIDAPGKKTIKAPQYTLSDLSQISDLILRSDDKALETSLNKIRSVVKNSSIVSSGGNSASFSSTTTMPSQIPTIVNEFISSTSLFLSNIVAETDQFAQISNSINQMNYNLEREAVEIEDINIVLPEYGKPSQSKEEETAPQITLQNTIPPEKEKEEEKETSQVANSITATAGTVISTTAATLATGVTGISGNMSQIIGSSSNQSSQGTTIPQNNTYIERTTEQLDMFPEYANLITDEDSLVYESTEGYKLVIHNDGKNVTGVEHYYEFDNMELASSKIDEIRKAYTNNKFFKGIVQDGNKVKVIFDNRVYENQSLANIENLYNNLENYTQK